MANRKIAGVCAGLANYLNLDATLVRIAMVTAAIAGGFGFIAYLIAWIAMPKDSSGHAPYALPPVA